MSNFPEGEFRRQSQFEQAIALLRDCSRQLVDATPHLAKLYMGYFKALKAEGFTDDQALYLIGQHGSSLGMK